MGPSGGTVLFSHLYMIQQSYQKLKKKNDVKLQKKLIVFLIFLIKNIVLNSFTVILQTKVLYSTIYISVSIFLSTSRLEKVKAWVNFVFQVDFLNSLFIRLPLLLFSKDDISYAKYHEAH